jgi:hypothetical protein
MLLLFKKIKRKIGFYLVGPCASLLAHSRKPAWPAHPACLLLPRVMSDRGRGSPPYGCHAPATGAPGHPVAPAPHAPAYSLCTCVHLLCSLPLPPSVPAAAEHAPVLASATAHASSSSELAVPATVAHRQRLHLPPSTVSSSRNPCSPWLAVVMSLSSEIARRRLGMLTGEEPLRGHLHSASPPALFSRAQAPHRVPDAPEHLHSP